MKKIAVLLLVPLSLISCRNKSKLVTEVKEVITIVERVDTVIVIQRDTAQFRTTFDNISESPRVFETPTQKVTLSVDKTTGDIVVDAEVKERQVPVWMERTTITDRTTKNKDVTKTVPDRKQKGVRLFFVVLYVIVALIIGAGAGIVIGRFL